MVNPCWGVETCRGSFKVVPTPLSTSCCLDGVAGGVIFSWPGGDWRWTRQSVGTGAIEDHIWAARVIKEMKEAGERRACDPADDRSDDSAQPRRLRRREYGVGEEE